MNRMKRLVKILFGIALGAGLLALSLRGVDGARVWESLRSANPLYILASIIVGMFGHNFVRALRWRIMLSPEKKGIGLYNLFSTTLIGYAISWALPMRLGEVMRPVLLAEREKIRVSAALTTVLIERFLDGLSVVTLFAVALTMWKGRSGIGAEGEKILRYAWTGGAVMLALSVILFGALLVAGATRRSWEPRLESLASRTHSRAVASAARAGVGLVEGGAILRRPASLALVVILSLVTWIVIGIGTWLGLAGGGIRLGFADVFVLMPASVLGIAAPTPGGAGSFEFFVKSALQLLFNQPADRAFAATLILHVVITLLPVVIAGLFLLWYDGISLQRLRELAASIQAGGLTMAASEASGAGGIDGAGTFEPRHPPGIDVLAGGNEG